MELEWLTPEAQENVALTFLRSAAHKGIPCSTALTILRANKYHIRTQTAYEYYKKFATEEIIRPTAWRVPLNRYPGEGTRVPAYPEQKRKYVYRMGAYWMDPRTGEAKWTPINVGFNEKKTIGEAVGTAYDIAEIYDIFPGVDLATVEIRFEGWSERGVR